MKTNKTSLKTNNKFNDFCAHQISIYIEHPYNKNTNKNITTTEYPFLVSQVSLRVVLRSKTPPGRTPFIVIFRCLVGSNFDQSLLGFPPQLASTHLPTSMKNRCQEAPQLGLRILIDFSSIDFSSMFAPLEPQNSLTSMSSSCFWLIMLYRRWCSR